MERHSPARHPDSTCPTGFAPLILDQSPEPVNSEGTFRADAIERRPFALTDCPRVATPVAFMWVKQGHGVGSAASAGPGRADSRRAQ